jgi:NADPH:quinone reductase-like Zn-dependent oxidoreductase
MELEAEEEDVQMKAAICQRYGPPEVLQLKEVERPPIKEDEVEVQVHATAVTSSDCIVRSGKVSPALWIPMRLALGFTGPRRPILGMVFAGGVESVGKEVKSFMRGDQVFGFDRFNFGTYAEYKRLPESGVITSKPSNVAFEEAAAIPYGGLLALHYLRRSKVLSGQRVLIYGASGAVGTSAVQLARYFGAEITGVCSTANLELVRSLGAGTVIDYMKDDFTRKGELYDVIFDAVPRYPKNTGRYSRSDCKKALAPNGKYVGVDQGRPGIRTEDLVLLRELVEAGKLKPVIDKSYPLEQIVEAHRYVDTGHKKGNVIVTVGQNTMRQE